MEYKYKNRTYWIESSLVDYPNKWEVSAQWRGYCATGDTTIQACEKCHQMIEEDMDEVDMLRQESELE